MVKLFVWDFHGVLEKGNEYSVVEVTNQVLKEFGQKSRVDLTFCRDLYGKKWGIYYKKLCPDLDEETILKMVNRGVEISNQTDIIYRNIKPMDYSHEVLGKIKKAGHENMILSNTEPKALDKYLDSVKINDLIDHKIGADSHRKGMHEQNSKIHLMLDFLKSKNYKEIIVIGDSETDIELGHSIRAKTYFFLNGFNKRIEADYYIDDLRALLKEI